MTPSQERLLDAEELEKLAEEAARPSVRLQLESLGKKLRKEAEALGRIEAAHSTCTDTNEEKGSKPDEAGEDVQPAEPPVRPAPAADPAPVVPASVKFTPIDRFSFDAGGSNSEFVTIYIDLPRVGSIPRENITCNFDAAAFDLIVKDHADGQSYRLCKDQLEHDLNVERCKIVVKTDKILVKIAKKKTDYGGFEYWSKLVDPKRSAQSGKKEDPQASIMSLMKEMYDSGDDQMKKMIGETMLKQQRGELGKDDYMSGMDNMM